MSKQNFFILLLFIFAAEVAVMEVFDPVITQLSTLPAALFDAGILALLLAPPLWLLCSQFPAKELQQRSVRVFYPDRVSLFSQLLGATFIVEFLVMLALPTFLPDLSGRSRAVLDATLTILFVLPVLWHKLYRIGKRFQKLPLTDFLSSPLMLYGTLLYAVFFADMIQEIVQPYLTPGSFDAYFILVDSSMTTAIVAPFLWLLVGRPLTKTLRSETIRTSRILDQIVDAVITLDVRGQIVAMNPAAQKVFGLTLAELAGQSVEVLFAENQLNISQLISETSSNKPETQKLMLHEALCRDRGGSTLTMNISLSSTGHHDQEEWLMILHDITHHKETERALRERDERFRQIFEQSDDAIAFFNPNVCSIIDVNITFSRLFGYSKAEIRKKGLEYLLGPDDLLRVSKAIRETAQGTTATIGDCIGFRRNGMQFNLSMRSKLMTIDGVRIIFCSFRDITSRLRLEKEAKDIQAKLIQTNKMTALGLMVSGVAHEINNPNNFIINNSRLLASTWEDNRKILHEYYLEHGDFCLGGIPFSELDTHAPQLFAGILEGSSRINAIVKNLKSFYRPEQITAAGVDINQVAASAASLLHHELVNFTKNFQITLAEGLPTVTGNSQQIGQVVINLLMNACQSLPDKDHGIWLETGFEPTSSHVTLTVRDEGRGMNAAESRRIMEPFFTTKLDEGGSGLGLAISKSIIMEHQGSLDFESKPGKGTTFTVRFPAENPAQRTDT